MTSRRTFLKQSTSLVALRALTPIISCSGAGGKLNKIGIQLFSLPKLLEKDVVGAISILQNMGYSQLELYGPYTFSEPAAWERWKSVTPSLGFNGSGYFERDVNEFKSILDDHGMTSPSAHTDLGTLRNGMSRLAEAAHILGHQYVTLPAIPAEHRTSLDDYYRMAEIFNEIGQEAKKEGIKFAYHNHGYGIQPAEDGVIPLEIIINNTDPGLVFLEMDIFWTTAGGADPISYLTKYSGRYKMLHLKDMKPKVNFSGDGGDPSQWIELFPNMTNVGDGDLDVAKIVEAGLENGVQYFFVEQDMVANPETALKKSIDFLKTV